MTALITFELNPQRCYVDHPELGFQEKSVI